MKTLIVALLLIISLPSFATDEWSSGDIYREVAWQTLNIIDELQTEYDVARNPNIYEEVGAARNFIGAHPSVDQVRIYFIASALVHYVISDALRHGWRDTFQYATIWIESDVTGRNVQIHGGLILPF